MSPLQAQREWISQAEENVLDRLTQAGLLAAPSDFDKVLEQVTNNIIIGNNIELAAPVHCRVMLTTPLESIAVGNTIILSKGLVDTLPTEASLAAVLSFQLAHIVLGHHIDTKYAFNDRLLFPDESTFSRIQMHHTDADDIEAAKKAVVLLDQSIYKDKMPASGPLLRAAAAAGEGAQRVEYTAAGRFDARFDRPALADRYPKAGSEAGPGQAGSDRSSSSGQPPADRCMG